MISSVIVLYFLCIIRFNFLLQKSQKLSFFISFILSVPCPSSIFPFLILVLIGITFLSSHLMIFLLSFYFSHFFFPFFILPIIKFTFFNMYFHVTSIFSWPPWPPPIVPPPSLFVSMAPSCPSSFPPLSSFSFSFSTSLLAPHFFSSFLTAIVSSSPFCHIFHSLPIPLPSFFHLSFPFSHVTPFPSHHYPFSSSVLSILSHIPRLSFNFFCSCWIYLTLPLRKQAACKQATRGPMALS